MHGPYQPFADLSGITTCIYIIYTHTDTHTHTIVSSFPYNLSETCCYIGNDYPAYFYQSL